MLTSLVRAKILECVENNFGFADLKSSAIRDATGNIQGIAALMGLREMSKAKRNHITPYAAKHGQHMKIYSDVVSKM
jgi:hypothetical protein